MCKYIYIYLHMYIIQYIYNYLAYCLAEAVYTPFSICFNPPDSFLGKLFRITTTIFWTAHKSAKNTRNQICQELSKF